MIFFFGLDVEGGPNASAPNRSNPSKPGGSALARAGRAHRRGTRVVGHASRTSTSAKRAASADIARWSVEAGGNRMRFSSFLSVRFRFFISDPR